MVVLRRAPNQQDFGLGPTLFDTNGRRVLSALEIGIGRKVSEPEVFEVVDHSDCNVVVVRVADLH